MINQSNKILNSNITKLVNQPYKYGFFTSIERENFEKGLNEEVIRLISKKKKNQTFYYHFV
jgi:Fe-S cluster assembly protein SufB